MAVLTHYRDLINPAVMPDDKRRLLWEGIKAESPELADLLTVDGTIKELKAHFGASLRLTQAEIDRYIAAGQKIIEERS